MFSWLSNKLSSKNEPKDDDNNKNNSNGMVNFSNKAVYSQQAETKVAAE